jgi:hypothetical protein
MDSEIAARYCGTDAGRSSTTGTPPASKAAAAAARTRFEAMRCAKTQGPGHSSTPGSRQVARASVTASANAASSASYPIPQEPCPSPPCRNATSAI